MSWLNCRWFVLLASCLFGLVGCGHIGHLDAIQRLGFNAKLPTREANLTEDWYLTKYKIKKYSYLWTIDNFSLCGKETGEFLSSPTFPEASEEEPLKWSIRLYPKGRDKETSDNISVCVSLKESKLNGGEARARFKFSILDQNGDYRELRDEKLPEKFVAGTIKSSWGFNKYVARDTLLNSQNGLLPGDKLTLLCEIDTLMEAVDYSEMGEFNQSMAAAHEQLSNVLGQLYESRQFSDVILEVDDKEFKAHKIILAASSPVFKERFGDDLRESQVDRLELADIRPEILEELLRFIYTGRSSLALTEQVDQQQLAMELFKASRKYQVEPLESICERALIETISVDSVGQLLLFAHSSNTPEFKRKLMDFMVVNYRQVFETEGWRATIREASMELIVEVNKEIFK